jgi:hypothetical protein
MKPFVRPTSVVAVALFTLLGGGLAQVGCTSGGSSGGTSGKGGDGAGGSGQGGAGAEAGGSGEGGSGTATGGKKTGGTGGKATGGSGGGTTTGGSGNATGGTVAVTGGSGGTVAVTGGAQGTGPCDPATWRDTHRGGVFGPAAAWGGVGGAGKPYTKETISGVSVWVPGAYADAKDGEVAITFASSGMTTNTLETHSSKMIAAGYMPPMVYVVDGINWGNANTGGAGPDSVRSRADTLLNLFNAVRAKYPKISMDPKMHGTMGQSTAGAVAFDLAWARPDFFGVVIGASTSMMPFMTYIFPYQDKIDASNKDKIRIAFDVGECDLVSEQAFLPTTCNAICQTTNCICGGCTTALYPDADWPKVNRDVTKKLIDLGYKANLLIRARGTHLGFTAAIADDLAFAWRGVMCK